MSQDLDQQVRQAVMDFCRQAPRRYPVFSILLGIFILVLLIWYIPQWLLPAAGLSFKDRLQQINENRKIFGGGALALLGLYIAWVRSRAMRDQAEVDREQQLTDLYVKAIEQLGSEKLQIRLGGIYALERIARESAKDHWPIMEVLSAFVRENAPPNRYRGYLPEPTPEEDNASPPPPDFPLTDIQAVLTVLGRRTRTFGQGEDKPLDLREIYLAGADLKKANLKGGNLVFVNLERAHLGEANLQGAELYRVNLQWAGLERANLQSAHLGDANLDGALLWGANLRETILFKASFSYARLHGADFRGATGLISPFQVNGAIWDETTKWPEGFFPPPCNKKEESTRRTAFAGKRTMRSSFLAQLSQPRPDPGGGAAAAYGGMLALALLEKVARLEAQRPAHQGNRQAWEEKLAQIKQLTWDLDRLREEDVRAYAQMTQVRASGSRGREWQEAVAYGLQVPREIMAQAREALALLTWAGARCRKHLVSDLQVAREFLGAALQGAYHIARANLPLVADAARRQDFSQKLSQAAQKGQQLYMEAGKVLEAR